MGFKWYLLNEEKAQLGHRISSVLTGVQSLQDDLGGMGARQIARVSEDIVNQIRKILHGQWHSRYIPTLRELQKVAVALSKAIDEKDDLKEVIPAISQVLAKTSEKLGVKTNSLEAPEVPQGNVSQQDLQLTGQDPSQQPQPQPPQGMSPMGPPPEQMPPQGIPPQQMPPSGPPMGQFG